MFGISKSVFIPAWPSVILCSSIYAIKLYSGLAFSTFKESNCAYWMIDIWQHFYEQVLIYGGLRAAHSTVRDIKFWNSHLFLRYQHAEARMLGWKSGFSKVYPSYTSEVEDPRQFGEDPQFARTYVQSALWRKTRNESRFSFLKKKIISNIFSYCIYTALLRRGLVEPNVAVRYQTALLLHAAPCNEHCECIPHRITLTKNWLAYGVRLSPQNDPSKADSWAELLRGR